MSVGPRAIDSRDIVQTREFTAQERGELGRLWDKVVWRDGMGQLYTISFYLWYGFAAFLAVSVLMALRALNTVDPDLALQLAIAAVGFALALAFANWHGRRLVTDKYWSGFHAGDRYALEAEGIHTMTRRGRFSCDWNSVETIINDDRCLVAVLPGDSALFVLKAAFEGQDVDGFGAELLRRWHASRGTPQPDPAP